MHCTEIVRNIWNDCIFFHYTWNQVDISMLAKNCVLGVDSTLNLKSKITVANNDSSTRDCLKTTKQDDESYISLENFQQHVRCFSVQCCMTKKSYIIKNPNFPGKKWCLAFNALFDVSNIVWPWFTCLYLQNILLSQVWSTCSANLHLMRKNRWQSLYIFLQPQCMNVWYFEWTWLYSAI